MFSKNATAIQFPIARPETLYDIGCRFGEGSLTDDDIRRSIWEHFAGRKVFTVRERRKVKPYPLTYWKTSTPGDLDEMLGGHGAAPGVETGGDGSCGTWVHLLRFCMEAHGVYNGTEKTLQSIDFSDTPVDGKTSGFQVKSVQEGLPVQGDVGFPTVLFTDHCVIEMNNLYGSTPATVIFDPSYGVIHTDIPEFEQSVNYIQFYDSSAPGGNRLEAEVPGTPELHFLP